MSEVLLYDEKIEQEVFKKILDSLTFIEPEFISREEYNKLEGNILQKIKYSESEAEVNKKSINRKDFKLFLPEYITNNDKIEIYNILENDFSKELGFITGIKKIKSKIFYAVKSILENNKNLDENILENNNEKYSKLEELYKKVFNEEKLPDILEIKKYLSELTQKEKLDFKRDYISLARKSKNGQNISDIIDTEIDFHFEELFFRQGINNLSFGLEIITTKDIKSLESNIGKNIKPGKVYKVDKKVYRLNNKPNKEAILLRKKINIEKLKKELEEIRQTGNKNEIYEKELEVCNLIIKIIYNNFPYQDTNKTNGYTPTGINQTKETQCVGYSIVGHVFLEELGIKHKGISSLNHSALSIEIGGQNYIFDATRLSKIVKYNSKNNIGIYENIQIDNETTGTISFFKNIKLNNLFSTKIKKSEVNKLLLSQIYLNKGINENNRELLDKSLKLNVSYEYYSYFVKYFMKRNNLKLSLLYFYISEKITQKNISLDLMYHFFYNKEKNRIDTYINKNDFNGLKLYLLELEKR